MSLWRMIFTNLRRHRVRTAIGATAGSKGKRADVHRPALAIGSWQWLNGVTSGKIFLDWKGGGLWALMAAMMFLWCVLMAAWQDRAATWTVSRKRRSLMGLSGLALVPAALAFAASPAVYPPIDRTTGGPTGSTRGGARVRGHRGCMPSRDGGQRGF